MAETDSFEDRLKGLAQEAQSDGNERAALILLSLTSVLLAGDTKGLHDLAMACGAVTEVNYRRLRAAMDARN